MIYIDLQPGHDGTKETAAIISFIYLLLRQSPNRKIRLQTSRLVSSPNISSRLVSRDVLQEKSFWYRKVNVSKRRN